MIRGRGRSLRTGGAPWRYRCPDHPETVLHDDDPRSEHHQPRLQNAVKLVTCPIDGKVYSLARCVREPSAS